MSLSVRHKLLRVDADRAGKLLRRVRDSNAPWLVELVVLYSLLLVLAFVLPGPNELTAINPHPFWIPVLLLSMQYGSLGGFAAALVGSLLHWLIGAPVHAGSEDFYDYVYRIWREPMLWLGASVVLGGLRAQQLDTVDALRLRLSQSDTQRRTIADLADRLKRHCAALERAGACADDRSIEAGLVALHEVETASADQLDESIARAAQLLLGSDAYVVLEVRDGGLQVVGALTRQVGGRASRSGQDAGVVLTPRQEEALLRNRMLDVHRAGDAELLAGLGVMACPILAAGDRCLGVLVVQSMDPALLAAGAGTSLKALCSSIASSWTRERVVLGFDRERIATRTAGMRAVEDPGLGSAVRAADSGSADRGLIVVAGLDMRQRTSEPFDARSERRQTT